MILTNVIYSIIYVSYGKILKYRTCEADQHRARADKRTWYRCQGGYRNGRSLQNFKTTGIPIYSRGTEDWRQNSHTQFQSYIYRKAISKADSNNTRLCQSFRTYHKRYRNPGLRKISTQRPKAWLLENQLQNKFIWNIVLTDYQPKKLCWLTSF